MPAPFVDLFCQVVDNYGDIGVCWRLAKDLHHLVQTYAYEQDTSDTAFSAQTIVSHTASAQNTFTEYHPFYSCKPNAGDTASSSQTFTFAKHSLLERFFRVDRHYPIRLWVDDLHSFARIEPRVDPQLKQQQIEGICIMLWDKSLCATTTPATIVIEAFGTQLDEPFIQAMPQQTQCWFNLEYLSAETWVESFHGQASPQANGVPKYFFFPGFNEKTGGLIRESALLPTLSAFQHDASQIRHWLAQYLHPDVAQAHAADTRLVSIFCYPSAPFECLLKSLHQQYLVDARPTLLLIPEGVLPNAETILHHYLSASQTTIPSPLDKQYPQSIRIHRFSFLPQEQFDFLLSACEMNIVRGEDSFVRAIWSGKPFIWHIYEQQALTHIEKLNAWLNSAQAPTLIAETLCAWNNYAAWNNPQILPPDTSEETSQYQRAYYQEQLSQRLASWWKAMEHPQTNAIHSFYTRYQQKLSDIPSLAFSLLNFQLS